MVAFESPVDSLLPGEVAPEGGGIPDIRKVTRILEDEGIPCCMTGASALVWFGAGRVRWDWEICVPTEKMNQAIQLLKSEPMTKVYQPWEPELFQYGSLAHTFPRFRLRGIALRFQIHPSDDAYFNIYDVDRSPSGLPYPKLESFAQSLLDTQRRSDLSDLVDGMNFSDEWGEEHLNLDKTTDVAYAKQQNQKMAAPTAPGEDPLDYHGVPTHPTPPREIWQEAVRGKQKRIGIELPTEYFAT
ncbi:hypothetical protein AARAC_010655 [Aspergillus arachidicola]|uniref:Uncharacterized protein n=1 Tax=Aspergillus arachidicola TaxID=656916 RepID=A0A2G7FJF7_9EURO|nr:hypothetical protein AARAC_010655 [Aspergillus arachidicola]